MLDLMQRSSNPVGQGRETELNLNQDGSVTITTPDGLKSLPLKPLAELYGPGHHTDVDPESDTFLPLFMAIEGAIVAHANFDRSMLDSEVGSAVETLGLKPEADVGTTGIAQRIQLQLRLFLSLRNYSRQEVRTALRRISRSVARHTQVGGPQGYITFVRQFIPS